MLVYSTHAAGRQAYAEMIERSGLTAVVAGYPEEAKAVIERLAQAGKLPPATVVDVRQGDSCHDEVLDALAGAGSAAERVILLLPAGKTSGTRAEDRAEVADALTSRCARACWRRPSSACWRRSRTRQARQQW